MPWKKPWALGIEITDDLGQRVTLTQPAKKIIALYGAYNEILAAMGLEERLVGRTKADTLPPSILTKPSIGTHMRPNMEIILGLRPDLVIQLAGRREALVVVQQIREEGIPVAVFHPTRFAHLFSVIHRMGILTGEETRASRLVDSLKERLMKVEERLKGVGQRPTVFFEVRYPNLLGAGKGSIVHDIIQKAGGLNCVTHEKTMVRIGMEVLIRDNPQVYVVQVGPMNQNPSHPAERPHYQVLRAIKNKRVLMVDEQVYSRPGPRCMDAVEALAAFLYPDRF